jgi:hypothetical protein
MSWIRRPKSLEESIKRWMKTAQKYKKWTKGLKRISFE